MKTPAGFPHKDLSWLWGLIIVRSPLAKVQALASKNGLKTSGFEVNSEDGEHTLFRWEKCEPALARKLSEKLKTTVGYVWDEDTSGWFGYSVFKNGEELEVFECGMNYDDELEGLAEELGEIPIKTKGKGKWDVMVTEDGEDFQFRSKVGKATEKEILQSVKFVDGRFKALGIPVPKNFPKKQVELRFAEK